MNDEKNRFDFNTDPDMIPGIVCKTADVQPVEITDADMKKINKYTLNPVTADDVFVFKAMLADNEQDDRNDMPFNLRALKDLSKLYIGKTMLKDHYRRADNQVGRIFETELITDDTKQTEIGEKHAELHAKIYMMKTETNKDFITEIVGGIKKEVSTSCRPAVATCSICGVDNMKSWCRHYAGDVYEMPDGTKKKCSFLLDGATEAYELSFVAVPAQRRAGTHKNAGFIKPISENETPEPLTDENNKEIEKTDHRILEQQIKNAEIFFNNYNTESEVM